MIEVRRIYDHEGSVEGDGFLVDRLWPRGVKKEVLGPVHWVKEVAPSDGLRRWFGHEPVKWADFKRRYFAELDGRPEAWQPILDGARRGNVTLLYGARDREHNQAVALKEYLDAKLAAKSPRKRPRSRARESVKA